MPTNRRFGGAVVAAVAFASTVHACGGDDSTTGPADAKVWQDAMVFMDAPGSGSSYMGLGQPCTPPTSGSGQGDCPAGYICLALTGASHPWCSKPCATGSGDTCAMGYTGPSVAGCINMVTFNGGAPMNFCGITCAGDGVNGCTTATCTGMCPGMMVCTGMLTNGSGQTVGSACQ